MHIETGHDDDQRPVVLHVGGWPRPIGGVAVHLRRLTLACHELGLPTKVFDPYRSRGAADPAPFDVIRPNKPFWLAAVSLASHTRRYRPDWIHVHASRLQNLATWGPGLLFATPRSTRIAVTIHGSLPDSWADYGPLRRWICRFVLERAALVICVSDRVRRLLEAEMRLDQEKLLTLPAYLPPSSWERAGGIGSNRELEERFLRWAPARSSVVLSTGAMLPVYGLDLIAAAAEKLATVGFVVSHYDAPWAGAPDPEYAEETLAALCALPNVLLVEDPPQAAYFDLLSRADAFVRPSHQDGDSVALREAVAEGCRTLASDCVDRPPGVRTFKSADATDLVTKLERLLDEAAPEPTAPVAALFPLIESYGCRAGAGPRDPQQPFAHRSG